ncbi:hypothetical protein [Micromonospora sp. NPDC049301]|uniref:hypothetical protein n=1 Tax=Micromonospora sp. NPDC049301 TaxID=3155723 RepID=UPI00341203F1
MSEVAEDELRAAVRQLAGEARAVPDLAGPALRRGRRLRGRRRAATAAVALFAVAALTGPYLWLRATAPSPIGAPEPAPPTPTAPVPVRPTPAGDWRAAPLSLPGGWVVTAVLGQREFQTGDVLDRSRNRYVSAVQYDQFWPSPTGTVTAVGDEARPQQTGLIDMATGRTRWFRTGRPIMTPQWSPDGRRLVLTITDKDEGGMHFGVLNVGGDFRIFPVDTDRYFCTDYCFFTWIRGGREVVLQQTDPGAPRSESVRHARRGVQLFSADDGRPTRFLAMPGDPAGPWSWSPDGGLVVVRGQTGPLLVEVGTGRVVRALPSEDAVWVSADLLLYRRSAGDRDFVLADPAGRELERQPLPTELVDREIVIAPR